MKKGTKIRKLYNYSTEKATELGLTRKEQIILAHRLQIKTLAEVGEEFQVPRERIHQLEVKLWRKIKPAEERGE